MPEKNSKTQKTSDIFKMHGTRTIKEDHKLREFLEETLKAQQLRKKKHQSKVTSIEERKIKNNDDKKVRILDNYIFRSMANLIYFFTFMIRHPQLMDRFGEDIEELLGLKEDVDDVKFQSSGLETLINLILTCPYPYSQYLDDTRFNFKRHLPLILQKSVQSHVMSIMHGNRRDMLFKVMADNDFERAVTWAKNVDREPRNMRKTIGRKIMVSDIERDR